MPGIGVGAGIQGVWVWDRTAKAPAHMEIHPSHNPLIQLSEDGKGRKKIQKSKNHCVFTREEVFTLKKPLPLNPPSFPSINNKTKLRD